VNKIATGSTTCKTSSTPIEFDDECEKSFIEQKDYKQQSLN